ncbi:eukaryotic translation initiation factor 3 subunit 6 [Sugiyamaella lignohabitans]|uniref:Eukaryotic translation initiation factor 3 subunit E n=1 Tax=Sugiyamaella lignohabitans TaxID=796027 RepID=A0A167FIQ2_9ASCO|nr:eukaryotic translation initiation factor 3 subunit 6 [Sugiyamaella lignohabitans]ANB15353.1 eukaryotic translation initiation factor 3 subunit 6 [Sugiyamaella lignohabitans]
MSESTSEVQPQREPLTPEGLAIAVKYDLTEKLMPHLDRHLIFPLLESLSSKELYDEHTLLQLKYDLLKDASMVDYTISLWKELHDGSENVPEELIQQKDDVLKQLETYEKSTSRVLEVFEDPEARANLKQDKVANLQFLESKYQITGDMINDLYKYGQLQYNCGKYHAASDLLYHVRILTTDSNLITSATWGKFAADILTLQWEAVAEELQKLRDIVDQRSFADPLTQLHHRTWIIHWSLFPFFNIENGKESLCDLFFSSAYINTIQASCPWILRYLTAAVVAMNKGPSGGHHGNIIFQKRLKDLIRVVGQEKYEYQDPLTEFIRALYIDYDFEEAQAKLSEAEIILNNDFFLADSAEAFLESARHLISELYCRIHQRIDVNQLSTRLNLSTEQGEKWIANLIQGTKMDAKIDESEGLVIMNHPVANVYQQVIEKTKGLTFRSNQVLSQAVNKHDALVS